MQRFSVENINELIVLLFVWASSRGEPKSVISSVSAERQEKIEDEETDRNKMFGGYSLNSTMIFSSLPQLANRLSLLLKLQWKRMAAQA